MARRKPDETKLLILKAATAEFAAKGLGGARVDAIAERAGANKRMLYHYFGNKDDLYTAVMEEAYAQIRGHEAELHLEDLEPVEAVRKLVTYTFNYYLDYPEFISLLNDANLYGAVHVKRSERIQAMHSPMVDRIREVLDRGAEAGEFRTGVDPVQLYVTIAALGYFYLSNASTLGAIFGRKLTTQRALADRLEHAVDVVVGFLRPDEGSAGGSGR